jgi:predicted phosphodiesterase
MRTAVIADIHGNDVAFEAVVSDLRKRRVNSVVFLGDLVAKGPQPQEVYDRMGTLNPLIWLKGNTDGWLDDALMDILPTTEKERQLLAYYDYMSHHLTTQSMDNLIGKKPSGMLHLGHYEVMCAHGTPKDNTIGIDLKSDLGIIKGFLKGVNASVILVAHTHRPSDEQMGIYRIINPGTVGMCNGENVAKASYAIIDTSNGFCVEHHLVDYNIDLVCEIAAAKKFPYFENYRALLTQS